MNLPLNSKKVPCPVCGGSGIIPTPRGDRWQTCPRCGGKGWIITSVDSPWKDVLIGRARI